MSLDDYNKSKVVVVSAAPTFAACVMAAMRRARPGDLARLRQAFPEIWEELDARYRSPGGILPTDRELVS